MGYPKGLVRQQRPLRWYHHVPRYCRSNAERNHCFGSIHHESQDHLPTRKEILRLDWWFHLGLPLHLPNYVDHQTRIRRSRPIHRPPKMLLICLFWYHTLYALAHNIKESTGFFVKHKFFSQKKKKKKKKS